MAKTTLFKYVGGGFIAAITLGLIANYMAGQTIGDLFDMVTPNADVSTAKADDIYLANRSYLISGYKKGDNAVANTYTDWKAASTAPEKTGDIHSGRYMMTFVNAAGYDEYIEFKPTGANMPIGTKIAKETFMLKGEGKFRPSPLFTMEKIGLDDAPDTDGWFYGRVNAKGRDMPTSQKFCHSCHQGYKTQDFLGYPALEVRVGYTPKDTTIAPAKFSLGDAVNGQEIFQSCAGCHSIGEGAKNAFGPVLTDIVGRQAGSYPEYSYSKGLKAVGETGFIWTEEKLFEYLENPSKFLRNHLGDDSLNSKMPVNFADEKTRNDVIAYLAAQK